MNDKNITRIWELNIQRLLLSILCVLVLTSCEDQKTILETMRGSGELRFVTVESPLTYFKGSDGNAEGLEYELASMFAESLNLELNLIIVKNEHDVVSYIKNNKALIGSAASALFGDPDNTLQYGPAYITAKKQLVYHQNNIRPKSIADIVEDEMTGEDEPYKTLLKRLSFYDPALAGRVLEDKNMAEILELVNENSVAIAIADSNWVATYRYLFPRISVAFDITGELPVAWIYRRNGDDSLDKAVRNFFKYISKNGSLDELINRYYQHTKSFDYIDTRVFIEKIHNSLPKFRKLFMESAKEMELDWLLLAAMSYQESHWDPKAKSPTGVRGLMMLTTDTAKLLNVDDRLDPRQSIRGGARYLVKMLDKIPERIQGEDRIWFALAAYNVGFGHLEDGRRLTQLQGGDPDKWSEVSERLPLLAKEQWHKGSVYGYARGTEPVIYVKNIRRYYDILKWKNSEIERAKQHEEKIRNFPIINSAVL